MRVLTVSSLFPDAVRPRFGPFVERQTLGLAAHPGVEVRVVAPIGVPPPPLSLHARYWPLRGVPLRDTWQGLTVYRPRFVHIPGVAGRFDSAAMARALIPLCREIRAEFAFDVIDASFFFPDGPAAVALGTAFDVPVSIKARGSDIHVWGAAPAARAQIVGAARRADGLLAVSAALKADMVAMDMPADKIGVHYTGVDLALFTPVDRIPAKATLGIAGPLVVCVGNLLERKGQRLVVDALAAIEHATLVLIGQGADEGPLVAKVAARGLEHRVRFTGSLDHRAVAAWLAAADVMVLASAAEGLANVWIEALACGTPIVITDVGGAREVVTCPAAGAIVAANPPAIAAAIRSILADPPPVAAVRACAERFTWDVNTASLARHLRALIRR